MRTANGSFRPTLERLEDRLVADATAEIPLRLVNEHVNIGALRQLIAAAPDHHPGNNSPYHLVYPSSPEALEAGFGSLPAGTKQMARFGDLVIVVAEDDAIWYDFKATTGSVMGFQPFTSLAAELGQFNQQHGLALRDAKMVLEPTGQLSLWLSWRNPDTGEGIGAGDIFFPPGVEYCCQDVARTALRLEARVEQLRMRLEFLRLSSPSARHIRLRAVYERSLGTAVQSRNQFLAENPDCSDGVNGVLTIQRRIDAVELLQRNLKRQRDTMLRTVDAAWLSKVSMQFQQQWRVTELRLVQLRAEYRAAFDALPC